MVSRLRLITQILIICIGIFAVMPSMAGSTESERPTLRSNPVVRGKQAPVLPDEVVEFLLTRDSETALIWVFFTDKQVFNQAEFEAATSSVAISPKVLDRRSRAGVDRIVFADLPVSEEYVTSVVNSGATVRRTSKWLNAASFVVAHERLQAIADLPFVASIRPIAGFKRTPPDETTVDRFDYPPKSQLADVLNYGWSQGQLQQINVPALHELGYDGSGVTLAIFDTGFRKSHDAFADHYADGRVLDEYDFIFDDAEVANEAADIDMQWNHGTSTWSTAGGSKDSRLYGPAYGANFLLAKTEDERSETQVEEDFWIAALEWADSLGVDVVTSSVGYQDWYSNQEMDGATAPITIAANTADLLGIIICQSMGNSGPTDTTLVAPADANGILACGSVNSVGAIASSSSRGPSADGRIKPEVCAQGVMDFMAKAGADDSYGYANGTSFSTPLVAGTVCLLLQARPTFPPALIRQALMETASRADSPDNTYGWGIIDALEALNWGADFAADLTQGTAPLTVQFTDASPLVPTTWHWDFGDGEESFDQNPSHEYSVPGAYDVSLTIDTDYGQIQKTREAYVLALGDTLTFSSDSVLAGQQVVTSVSLVNSQLLEEIIIPFEATVYPLGLTFDSVTRGTRTEYFEDLSLLYSEPDSVRYTARLTANTGGSAPALAPGSGEVMKIFVTTDPYGAPGLTDVVDTAMETPQQTELVTSVVSYVPVVYAGEIKSITVLCGDINNDSSITLSDITGLIDHVYISGSLPITMWSGDLNSDRKISLSDITRLIDHVYISKAPIDCLPDE